MRFLCCVLLALFAAAPTLGADRSVRVKVNGKGVIRLSAAQLRLLGVKASKEGFVGVQFPAPPRAPKPAPRKGATGQHDHAHAHAGPPRAPTFWTTIRPDRSLELGRSRVDERYLPGPAGTVDVATGAKDRVVLRPAR